MSLNVLFDLGGVIFKIDWTITNRILGLPLSSDWWNSKEYDAYERGQLSGSEFQTRIETKYSRKWDSKVFRKSMQDLIEYPLPGIEEILHSIQSPIFALSNTCEAHEEVFKNAKVMKPFRRVVTSFELGARKPEREAFEKCLSQLKIKAEETLYFDDREENVEGAKDCGLIAFQTLNSPETTKKILEEYKLI